MNFFCSITGHLHGHKRYLEASRVMEEYAQVGRVMCLAAFIGKYPVAQWLEHLTRTLGVVGSDSI